MASLDLSVLPGGDGQRQPSQSSRIVQVPRNASQDQQVGLVITKIEDVFEAMVDNLAHNGNALCIPYRSRTASPDQPARMLRFPGTTAQEATKFSKHSPPPPPPPVPSIVLTAIERAARMIRIMELCREALVSGRLITKRSLFSRPSLRGSISH